MGMGVRRGGQGGALAPPPLENFCPPLEKSLRTPMAMGDGVQIHIFIKKVSQYKVFVDKF
jgi:hypothetical protein